MTELERQQVHERLEGELVVLMRRLRRMWTVLTRRIDDGLEPSIYGLLAAFLDAGDVRASALADHFGLDKSTLSRQVAQLEALGLVERVIDPLDKRARLIHITDDGRERVNRLRSARGQWLITALEQWPADDVDRLVELLGELNTSVATELAKHRTGPPTE